MANILWVAHLALLLALRRMASPWAVAWHAREMHGARYTAPEAADDIGEWGF